MFHRYRNEYPPGAYLGRILILFSVIVSGWTILFLFAFELPSYITGSDIASSNFLYWILYLLFFGLLIGFGAISYDSNKNISFFSNDPLISLIHTGDLEYVRKHKPNVYCTLSPEIDLKIGDRHILNIVPEYFCLQSANNIDEMVAVLTQTAAIPEIFKPKKVRGIFYLDGGMADNVPILATLVEAPEVLIVVYLDHRYVRLPDIREFEKRRLLRIAADKGINRQKVLDWFSGSKFITLVPKENLGGFFNLFSFRKELASNLIARGYEDTLVKIRELSLT